MDIEGNAKKVLCSAEKSSVIWAEPHSGSSAEQFGRTERSVGHYREEKSRKKNNLLLKMELSWKSYFIMKSFFY